MMTLDEIIELIKRKVQYYHEFDAIYLNGKHVREILKSLELIEDRLEWLEEKKNWRDHRGRTVEKYNIPLLNIKWDREKIIQDMEKEAKGIERK